MAPGITTLADIRTAAKERSDNVNAGFISDAEWLRLINASYFELYDLLIQRYGENWYVGTPTLITTDGTNDKYALAADFYHLLGVDLQLAGTAGASSGQYVTLEQFNFADRNRFANPLSQTYLGRTNLRYRLHGGKLWLRPLPASGLTIQYWYAPRLTALVSDTDTVDGVSGWEEYVVVDAAIKALLKEESDASALMAAKVALVQRIESAASNRNAASPATVVDAQSMNDGYGPGRDGWGSGW